MGSLNPLGVDADSTWNVVAGHSGIQVLQEPWIDDLPVRLAGCVPTGALDSLSPLLRRRSDRCTQLALLAASGLGHGALYHRNRPEQVAVVVGTGIGGLATMHDQHMHLSAGGPNRVNPLTVPMLIPDAAAGQIAIDLGVLGGAHICVSLRFRRRSHDAGSDAAQRRPC